MTIANIDWAFIVGSRKASVLHETPTVWSNAGAWWASIVYLQKKGTSEWMNAASLFTGP